MSVNSVVTCTMVLLVILLGMCVFSVCCRSEHFALPLPNTDMALLGRTARPSRCTDGCLMRTRGVTGIDIQCAEMCKNWYPVTYDSSAQCNRGWGGYAQTPCSYPEVYSSQLTQSLESPLAGMYEFGNV